MAPILNLRIYHEYEGGIEKFNPRIAVWNHKAGRVMTNGNCEGQIFLFHPHMNNRFFVLLTINYTPGPVAQSVTCLATDACLTAIPGVASLIPARSHTFVEIDHEIISTVILLPSADSFKKGCCQLQAKVCARITGYPLVQACPGKSVVR